MGGGKNLVEALHADFVLPSYVVQWLKKNHPANAGEARDAGLTHGLGRSPEKGNGNPLWYSCLENFMDRGAWQVPWGCKVGCEGGPNTVKP